MVVSISTINCLEDPLCVYSVIHMYLTHDYKMLILNNLGFSLSPVSTT